MSGDFRRAADLAFEQLMLVVMLGLALPTLHVIADAP
jgi:hypothetical protein